MSESKTKKTASELRESAQKIWLAGLGALTVAEEEGNKLFKSLVEKGTEFEAQGREKAREAAGDVRGRVEETAEKVKSEASTLFSKVDAKIDDAVASAVSRAGVPTRDEIGTLTRRVEELTQLVEQMRETK